MFQLDLFNANDTVKPLYGEEDAERYAAVVRESRYLTAFDDRETIAIIAELIQGSAFTWSNTVEGGSYWAEVCERLKLISENIKDTPEHRRVNPAFTITRN